MRVSARINIQLAKPTNYLILGNWSDTMSYKLSDAGIPVVIVPDSTVLGFSAYSLEVDESTIGASPSGAGKSEWRLQPSEQFIYMQQAYIERLQAAIVTAEKIESLMIKTKNLQVLDDAVIGNFNITNGGLSAVYSYFTYIGTTYVRVTAHIEVSASGVVISSQYGGTLEHPQIVLWDTIVNSSGIKVGDMEVKRDGIYRNGSKIL